MDINKIINYDILDDPMQIFLYIFTTLSALFIFYVVMVLLQSVIKGILLDIKKKKENLVKGS